MVIHPLPTQQEDTQLAIAGKGHACEGPVERMYGTHFIIFRANLMAGKKWFRLSCLLGALQTDGP